MPEGLLWQVSQTKEQKIYSVISNQAVLYSEDFPVPLFPPVRISAVPYFLGAYLPSC